MAECPATGGEHDWRPAEADWPYCRHTHWEEGVCVTETGIAQVCRCGAVDHVYHWRRPRHRVTPEGFRRLLAAERARCPVGSRGIAPVGVRAGAAG